MIAWDVTILDNDSHSTVFCFRKNDVLNWRNGYQDWSHVPSSPITICSKAWVAFGAAISKEVTIGEGAVVAAMAVVTKDVPPWVIVAGNPARIVREMSLEEQRLTE